MTLPIVEVLSPGTGERTRGSVVWGLTFIPSRVDLGACLSHLRTSRVDLGT
jgi:hypothetical protein